MILILTEALDTHADYVEAKLRERGAELARFDPALLPVSAELSVSFTATGPESRILRVDGQTIDLDRVKAAWYRRPRAPIPHDRITDKATRASIAGECETFAQDVWNSLECLWVPAPFAVFRRTQLKVSQLRIAAALGFELPPTLFTNSPEDFLEFYRANQGDVISKLSGASFFRADDGEFCRFTEAVSRRDVGYAHSVRYCPLIFQARVPKRLELRITVVGRQVFACEIHSQATNHTQLDWRRYDHFATPHQPHRLPSEVADRCVQLVERLGLCYGALDLILTPDGRYVFIEINSNGQYLWTELHTGLPISDALCDLLMSA